MSQMTTSVMKDALRTPPLKGEGQTGKRSASGQKVAEYAKRICQGWQKTVGSIWTVAEDCFVAKNDFTASEKRDLIATQGNNEKSARKTSRDLELPVALYCVYPEKLLDGDQHKQIKNAIVAMAESEGLKAAVFTGENLIAQVKDFFSKKAVPE